MEILLVIAAIMLPVALGFFFKLLSVFSEQDTIILRRFVVKVTVPFIVFRNLYTANMESLNQILPSVLAMAVLTFLFSGTSLLISKFTGKSRETKNAYIFSSFVGNYGYLGWGVMFYFYGENGFTRSVFSHFFLADFPAFRILADLFTE